VNYNRIMLSPVLAGEKSFDEIVLNTAEWYADNGIELVAGDPVDHIDRERSVVIGRSGRVEPYDKLLIATGSDPFIIPVPGRDLPGVVTFRDLDDVDKMLAAAGEGGNAVVIGGGLLGLEAAHGLSLRGMTVTVVHLMPTLMERQLDEAAGWLLKTELERRGQNDLTGATPRRSSGRTATSPGCGSRTGARFPPTSWSWRSASGPRRCSPRPPGSSASAGSWSTTTWSPRTPRFSRSASACSTAAVLRPRRAAVGDVPRAGRPPDRAADGYDGLGHLDQAQGLGIDVFSAGDFTGGDEHEDIVMRDAARGVYKRVVLKDDRIVGAVLYGDTADGNWYFDLLRKQEDISEIRDGLIFGQAFAMGGRRLRGP
jgi:nitrite reductase (NADH) large subunit